MADIKLNDEVLNGVISGAILQALTPDVRQQMLTDAVKSLLEKSSNTYSHQSRLYEAFSASAFEVCRTIAREMLLEDPTIQTQMRAMLTDAWAKMIQDRPAVVDKLASAMAKVFDPRDY